MGGVHFEISLMYASTRHAIVIETCAPILSVLAFSSHNLFGVSSIVFQTNSIDTY
jgi:hypothetical protein